MISFRRTPVFSLIPFFVAIVLFVSLFIFTPKLIKIKTIDCQSQYGSCNNLVLGEIKEAENLSLDSSKKTLERILSNSVLVKNYSIQFGLPDKLKVNILEEKISFALTDKDKSSFALIDMEGNVILLTSSSNLPYLVIQGELPKVGDKVKKETLFAVKIFSSLSSYYQVVSAKQEENSLVVDINSGPQVIFPLEGDEQVLLGAANLLLSQLKSENENSKIDNKGDVKVIDLRFKNPVLK